MLSMNRLLSTLFLLLVTPIVLSGTISSMELDAYTMQQVFCRFPFARIVSLDGESEWGLMYADVYGKLRLLRSTERGWKRDWELTNLGSKIRKFFIRDIEGDDFFEVVIATVDGRILIYSMDDYQNLWENLEDNFSAIAAMGVENIDEDEQMELIILADKHLYIVDGLSKSRQWVSDREFNATEIVIDNVDKDDQLEIILNTGIVIDSRFFNIELEWDRTFGDRIMVFDMNNDGYPEIIGEFSDYSLQIFDVHARREVW